MISKDGPAPGAGGRGRRNGAIPVRAPERTSAGSLARGPPRVGSRARPLRESGTGAAPARRPATARTWRPAERAAAARPHRTGDHSPEKQRDRAGPFSRRVSQASKEGSTSWSSRRCERRDARREGGHRDPIPKESAWPNTPGARWPPKRPWVATGHRGVRRGPTGPAGSRRPEPSDPGTPPQAAAPWPRDLQTPGLSSQGAPTLSGMATSPGSARLLAMTAPKVLPPILSWGGRPHP